MVNSNNQEVVQDTSLGNSNIQTLNKIENNETNIRATAWCFTIFNNIDTNIIRFKEYFEKLNYEYIMGIELCPKTNKKHIQGYCYSKKRIYWKSLKKIENSIHLEIAKGDKLDNYIYCSKNGNDELIFSNMNVNKIKIEKLGINEYNRLELLKEYENIELYYWQQQVIDWLDYMKKTGNNRKILYVINECGNVGKSHLTRLLYLKNNDAFLIGKNITNTAFNIKRKFELNQNCTIGLYDCSKTCIPNESQIELLMNKVVFSNKYECGELILNKIQIVVFTNSIHIGSLNHDRYDILDLDLNINKIIGFKEWKNRREIFEKDLEYNSSDFDSE